MDKAQLNNLKSNYERMSDDEIAYLVSTRWEGLTDDARAALIAVSKRRNPAAIAHELEATASDLNIQSEYDKRSEAVNELSHSLRNVIALGIYCGALILVITGLLTAMTKDVDNGLATAGTGVILAGACMAREILRKFLRAIFSR